MSETGYRVVIGLGAVVACFAWLAMAMDFSDHVAVGTYYFSESGVQSRLDLRADHSFHQTLDRAGEASATTDGTWRRLGSSGLDFSTQFLPVPGMESYADGEPYGVMRKTLGIFVHVEMADGVIAQCFKIDDTRESLTGSYKCSDEPNADLLIDVKADHTFAETYVTRFTTRHADGTWQGEGSIQFSKEFLTLRGLPLALGETASDDDPRNGMMQIDIRQHTPFGKAIFAKRYLPWSRR